MEKVHEREKNLHWELACYLNSNSKGFRVLCKRLRAPTAQAVINEFQVRD